MHNVILRSCKVVDFIEKDTYTSLQWQKEAKEDFA